MAVGQRRLGGGPVPSTDLRSIERGRLAAAAAAAAAAAPARWDTPRRQG